MISKLLDTTNVSLTTAATAVTAPADLKWATVDVVLSAESGGSLVAWERQPEETSVDSKFCSAIESSLSIRANPGQTIFWAKMASGTATLDVEWWG